MTGAHAGPTSRRVAAVDLGTNAVRLLVADVTVPSAGPLPPGGLPLPVADVVRRTELVRLGEGLLPGAGLAPAALARTSAALQDYREEAERLGARHVGLVTTAAARTAGDASVLQDLVLRALGVPARVLSGHEEAVWTARGAAAGWAAGPAVRRPAAGRADLLCLDVGGGSTELVRCRPAPAGGLEVQAARSTPAGAVWLAERHPPDPPGATSEALAREVREALAPALAATLPAGAPPPVVLGVGGTVWTAALLAGRHPGVPLHGTSTAHVPVQRLEEVVARVLSADARARASLPGVPAGRADVLGAGLVVVQEVVRAAAADGVVAVVADLLDVAAAQVAAGLLGGPPAPRVAPGWR